MSSFGITQRKFYIKLVYNEPNQNSPMYQLFLTLGKAIKIAKFKKHENCLNFRHSTLYPATYLL